MTKGVEVITVWAPRPDHAKWRKDYISLMALQSRTAREFEHTHTIVTDYPKIVEQFPNSKVIVTKLPKDLMHAMIAGVIARLNKPCNHHLVFADIDVLVAKPLDEAFDQTFDLGLTNRVNAVAPINNGVMYVDHKGITAALEFFTRALAVCQSHWGGDQEAISKIAAPVPEESGLVEQRDWGTLAFLSLRTHACVPKIRGERHTPDPFTVHFKGEEAKGWARDYAKKYIFK